MSLLIKPWVKKNLNISFPVIAVQRTGNWDTLNPLTRYPRQYLLLHTCSSHKGLQQCSLPLLYESPAAEFTDRDRAKCNPISAGINHPALFFGCTICLKQHWFGGRCTMPQKKGEGGGRKGGGPNTCVKDYKNKTNCAFFFSGVYFFFASSYTDSWT